MARHGETAWTVTGQHTGLTDLPLTAAGERNARRLAERLRGLTFAKVFTSPLQRAVRTASWPGSVRSPKSIGIWSSGTTASMRVSPVPRFAQSVRTGRLFRGWLPRGRVPRQAAARADRVVAACARCRVMFCCSQADISFGYWPARWIGIEPAQNARSFMLSTASLSALGYENDLSRPVIRLWNDTHHVMS